MVHYFCKLQYILITVDFNIKYERVPLLSIFNHLNCFKWALKLNEQSCILTTEVRRWNLSFLILTTKIRIVFQTNGEKKTAKVKMLTQPQVLFYHYDLIKFVQCRLYLNQFPFIRAGQFLVVFCLLLVWNSKFTISAPNVWQN